MSEGAGILLGFVVFCLFAGGVVLLVNDGTEGLGVMAQIGSIILGAVLFEKCK